MAGRRKVLITSPTPHYQVNVAITVQKPNYKLPSLFYCKDLFNLPTNLSSMKTLLRKIGLLSAVHFSSIQH